MQPLLEPRQLGPDEADGFDGGWLALLGFVQARNALRGRYRDEFCRRTLNSSLNTFRRPQGRRERIQGLVRDTLRYARWKASAGSLVNTITYINLLAFLIFA